MRLKRPFGVGVIASELPLAADRNRYRSGRGGRKSERESDCLRAVRAGQLREEAHLFVIEVDDNEIAIRVQPVEPGILIRKPLSSLAVSGGSPSLAGAVELHCRQSRSRS